MEKDVTRHIEEQLSAFLDGELAEAELQLLVRRLEKEPAYRDTLARYAAIGGVMRGEPVALTTGSSFGAFRADVLDKVNADADAVAEALQPHASTRSARMGWRSAIAASVALVAAFGVYQGGYLDDPVGSASAPLTSERVAQQTPALVAPAADIAPQAVSRTARPGFVRARATLAPDRMTSYMVSHGEFSRAYHGPMVDARVFVQPARFDDR